MDSSGNTVANAGVGALATLVLVFLPFAPVVGGAIAGGLERGSVRDGTTAGAVTGLVLVVPLFLLAATLAPFALFAPAGVATIPGNATAFVVGGFLAVVVYAVGGASAGGAAGAYLAAVRSPSTEATPETAHAATGDGTAVGSTGPSDPAGED